MKKIIVLLAFFSSLFVNAQINPINNQNKYSDSQNMDVVYTSEASYPEGENALFRIVYDGIKYSEDAKQAGIKDDVLISFDVSFDSTLTGFRIIHGVGFGIDEQIVECFKKLKFKPAVMNGIQVRQNVMMTIPIRTHKDM